MQTVPVFSQTPSYNSAITISQCVKTLLCTTFVALLRGVLQGYDFSIVFLTVSTIEIIDGHGQKWGMIEVWWQLMSRLLDFQTWQLYDDHVTNYCTSV